MTICRCYLLSWILFIFLIISFQDEGPEQHECSHSEVVAASNTVSDLLTHRKNSGSFLKVFLLK